MLKIWPCAKSFENLGLPHEGEGMAVELSLIPTERSVTRAEVRERLATTASLRPFFQPQSVAIIGAGPVRQND